MHRFGQLPRILRTGWRPRKYPAITLPWASTSQAALKAPIRGPPIVISRFRDCHRDHSSPASCLHPFDSCDSSRIQVAANAPQGCHLGLCSSAFVVFLFSPNCSLLVAQLDRSTGVAQEADEWPRCWPNHGFAIHALS